MRTVINLYSPQTWPSNILKFLEQNRMHLEAWKTGPSLLTGRKYDEIVTALRNLIKDFYLRGFHCTRLTNYEIEAVKSQGMYLPNAETLEVRLDMLVQQRLLNEQKATQLKKLHRYDSGEMRENRIWFCFFPPYTASEHGIRDFFKYWGGESLYRGRGDSKDELSNLGAPCLVEAEIRIGSLSQNATLYALDWYMKDIGLEVEANDFEGSAIEPIPADCISQIIQYPSDDFFKLTHADQWESPLDS